MGPARRRTRRFIADFYSDTDGFVNGRRDYVGFERRIQIREREVSAKIPRGTESRDREGGTCHLPSRTVGDSWSVVPGDRIPPRSVLLL